MRRIGVETRIDVHVLGIDVSRLDVERESHVRRPELAGSGGSKGPTHGSWQLTRITGNDGEPGHRRKQGPLV